MQSIVSKAQERGAPVKVVSDAVMLTLSDTVTPSGILAVLPMSEPSIPHPLTWVLVVDRLRDPGNMGTILRSAVAAGIDLVITSKGTVDVYSPKVVRAGMGAHFRLELCLNQRWSDIGDVVKGLRVLVAEPRGGVPYWEINWGIPTALLIGGEARGARSEADELATGHVSIPMRAGTDSLNAAVAASVLLLEGARQRSSCGC
jgi:TrmH family RNA methyltransferase